ncbi:hypothetical protein GCM10010082_09340 [Kushneria pakistanensis]|uniref:Rieske domain-containing protein n=1 Tax=Kushneria pakistanensis TaxID=1508770 RepID=A0ABQ3FDI9_9GAMM|nr:hypothetical protein GCM10010082_09340 [Kushneria pakistanensis]
MVGKVLQPGRITFCQLVSPETGPAIIQGGDVYGIISNDCHAYGSIRRSTRLMHIPIRWPSLPTATIFPDAVWIYMEATCRHGALSCPAVVEAK